MFIITVLAVFCCCLRLCIPQATRLPYRDLADSYVAFLALNSERPNTRGSPSSVRTSAGFPAYAFRLLWELLGRAGDPLRPKDGWPFVISGKRKCLNQLYDPVWPLSAYPRCGASLMPCVWPRL